MFYYSLPQLSQCCSNWAPWQATFTTGEDKATEIIAASCDDWDWALNSSKYPSPRRRWGYANDEKKVTHVTAVFCDDWKYSEDEAPPHVLFTTKHVKQFFDRRNCQTLLSDFDDNDSTNYTERNATLSGRLSDRQCRKRYSTSKKKPYSRVYTRSQTEQHATSESEEWQSSSINGREGTEASTPSAMSASVSDPGSPLLEPATPKETTSCLPSSALPGLNMAINTATLTRTERNIFISLAPEGLKDPCALMNSVSKKRDEMMNDPTPTCSPVWDGSAEDNEPVWDQGMGDGVRLDDKFIPKMDEGLERLRETTFSFLKDPCALMESITKKHEVTMSDSTSECLSGWSGCVGDNEPDWRQGIEDSVDLDEEIISRRGEGLEKFPETTLDNFFDEFVEY